MALGASRVSATESQVYGRDEADWNVLTQVGEEFLIERARLAG
jgi:hypothetical protein